MTQADVVAELVRGFSNNSPWAAMAGFLMWQIIKAWQKDREDIPKALAELTEAINGLRMELQR
jgi:hypothetical protein